MAILAKLRSERVLRFGFAVHQPNGRRRIGAGPHGREPAAKLAAIGVRAVAVENLDRCTEWHVLAQNPQDGLSLHDPPPRGVFGLESDDQNRRSWVRRRVK